MNDNTNVDVAVGCHVSEIADYFVLEVEFGVAFGLVGEHELEIINTD